MPDENKSNGIFQNGVSYLQSDNEVGEYTFLGGDLRLQHGAEGNITFANNDHSIPRPEKGSPGKFVMPTNEMDALLDSVYSDPEGFAAGLQPKIDQLNIELVAAGEEEYILEDHSPLRLIEASLGLEQGELEGRSKDKKDKLGCTAVRVDIPYSPDLDLRIPDGTESGANKYHLQGTGKTIGGHSEGVITNNFQVTQDNISLLPNRSRATNFADSARADNHRKLSGGSSMASIVDQIKMALQNAVQHIDSQLSQIQAYGQNNQQLMQQINQAVTGSNNSAANNMQRQLPQTVQQLANATQTLSQAKSTLTDIQRQL